jgi:hypothetical protein
MGHPIPRLYRRLTLLRNLEAINVVLIPAFLVGIWMDSEGPVVWLVRILPLFLVSFVLAQGALYWHWKLRSVRRRMSLPASFCATFRRLYRTTMASLLVIVAVLLAIAASGLEVRRGDWLWAVGLLIFAGLEVVNYYHWQLSHDNIADLRYLLRHRRLRRAPLASDLRTRYAEVPCRSANINN